MMTETDKQLALDLSLGNISKDEFMRSFSVDLEADTEYIISAIENACRYKLEDDVEITLLIGFHLGFPKKCVQPLCNLILQDWHTHHENIVLALQEIKEPYSIDYLYQTALRNFDYLDYDESYALGVKCIWAIHAINTDYGREKLLLLAQCDNQILAENAQKRLSKQA